MSNCLKELKVDNLEQMQEKRRKWVEANRDNGFDKGINNLLTQLYPDNAHFIYELLQNAEDTGASTVQFTLNNSAVTFKHNGERLFSLEDICSITSIGNSTKLDQPTSIGKFGVGFKAVFAYTNIPEIHSGDFHFRIRDLVVPETEGVPRPRIGNQETRFIFPFNNPKKLPNKAAGDVERGLRALGNNTLLFLSHILKIEYLLPDGALGTLDRLEHKDGHIEIRASQPGGKETISHWLLFDKDVEVTDEDGKLKTCRIAIAYSLAEEDRKKKQSKWKIVPLEHGQVSIYFPAEKETSNLRFHIHAPFASTVARDGVRDCPANEDLRDHLKNLAVESLADIRDRGMLDVSFLTVLPNPADNLPNFYEPIREAIVEAFCEQDLTPTRSGEHKPAGALYCGPAKIAEFLGDEGLSWLTNYELQSWLNGDEISLWAANAPQENQREDRFLQSLEIDKWGWRELASSFYPPHPYASQNNEYLENSLHKRRIEYYISEMDDSKLMRFYALLGEASDAHDETIYIGDLRVVRVTTEDGDEHVTPGKAYLLPENNVAPPPDVLFVKPEVYSAGQSPSQKKFSRSFLETVGVCVYDEQAGIKRLLGLYKGEPEIPERQHQKHIRQFIAFWKEHPRERGMFREVQFLQVAPNEDELVWSTPDQLCLDKQYLDTGLSKLTEIHEKYALADGYGEFLKGAQLSDFVAFLKDIGVMHRLHIRPQSTWERGRCEKLHHDYRSGTRQGNTTDVDYTIDNMEKYLSAESIPASRLLWNALLEATEKCASAQYTPNSKYPPRHDDSWLVIQLRENAWIPDKSGKFRSPQEMTQDDLRTDFPFDDRNGLLTAICFGEKARKQSDEYRANNQAAKIFGIPSADIAEEIGGYFKAGLSMDAIRGLASAITPLQQPECPVPNPERRRRGVIERRENAPTRESVVRERSIQPGSNKETLEAKAYLREMYQNLDNLLICQCCQREMPFKLKSDLHYFEAIQCVRGLNKHLFENHLALCPTCAAMYQHARETGDAEIRRSIVEHEADDKAPAVEIPVRLAGRELTLRFVGKHWFDLRTVLSQ